MTTDELRELRRRWRALDAEWRGTLRARCEGRTADDIARSTHRSLRMIRDDTRRALSWFGITGHWETKIGRFCYALGRMDASADEHWRSVA